MVVVDITAGMDKVMVLMEGGIMEGLAMVVDIMGGILTGAMVMAEDIIHMVMVADIIIIVNQIMFRSPS